MQHSDKTTAQRDILFWLLCIQILKMCVQRLQSGCVGRAFDGWLSRVETKKSAREKMQLVRIALTEATKVTYTFTRHTEEQ